MLAWRAPVDLLLRIANYENFTLGTRSSTSPWYHWRVGECARFCAGAIFIKLLPLRWI